MKIISILVVLLSMIFVTGCDVNKGEIERLKQQITLLEKQIDLHKQEIKAYQRKLDECEQKAKVVEAAIEKTTLKQKYVTAMQDLKNIGTGITSYMTDTYKAPDVKQYAGLEKELLPFHMQKFPKTDPWGNPYFYKKTGEDEYIIGCAGSDGKFEGFSQKGSYSAQNLTGQDIVYSNGTFIYHPK